MNKRFLFVAVMICFLHSASYCQNSTDAGGQLESIAGNSGVFSFLLELANSQNLENFQCNNNRSSGGDSFRISFLIKDYDSLQKFIDTFNSKYPVGIDQFSLKPAVSATDNTGKLNITMTLNAGSRQSPVVADLFKPLVVNDFQFFSPGKTPLDLMIFSMNYVSGKQKTVSLLAIDIDNVKNFASRAQNFHVSRISKSNFGTGNLFNFDINETSAAISDQGVPDVISAFSSLSSQINADEVAMNFSSSGKPVWSISGTFKIDSAVSLFEIIKSQNIGDISSLELFLSNDKNRLKGKIFVSQNDKMSLSAAQLSGTLAISWPVFGEGEIKLYSDSNSKAIKASVYDSSTIPEIQGTAATSGWKSVEKKVFSDENGKEYTLLVFDLPGEDVVKGDSQTSEFDDSSVDFGKIISKTGSGANIELTLAIGPENFGKFVDFIKAGKNGSIKRFTASRNEAGNYYFTIYCSGKGGSYSAFEKTVASFFTKYFPFFSGDKTKTAGLVLAEFSYTSDGKIKITGTTPKSGLIFSHLFKSLESIPGITEPFFQSGNYFDSPEGRMMNFQATARGASAQ
ncbi:MAG: hypothetical protein HQM10_12720 [Candidatus Riflebacteria bacterium]|nr:hypothetical protein [Candidatus Riflebacteria bacterium]